MQKSENMEEFADLFRDGQYEHWLTVYLYHQSVVTSVNQ